MNINHESLLRDLVDKLSARELSIVQIVQENTGVITLNDQDCQWIECLSRASFEIEEEYFPKANVQFNFNFLYIQFYIIRSYLLICRINYHHVHQKYQCYIQQPIIDRTSSKKSIFTLNDPQFSYLQEMTLGKLYYEYNLLRKMIDLLKHHQDDISNMNFHQFLRTTDDNNELIRQLEECQIKDFQLCYIDDVCQLYEELINNFHYSILNISHLLRIPIDNQQNTELDEMFIQSFANEQTQDFKSTIRTITEFLNELKDIEESLQQQSSLSLTQVCEWMTIENPILAMIPKEIKCENYVPLIIKLIEIRSKLQERTIEKEEQNKEKWNDSFNEQSNEQENTAGIFQTFVDKSNDSSDEESNEQEDTTGIFQTFVDKSNDSFDEQLNKQENTTDVFQTFVDKSNDSFDEQLNKQENTTDVFQTFVEKPYVVMDDDKKFQSEEKSSEENSNSTIITKSPKENENNGSQNVSNQNKTHSIHDSTSTHTEKSSDDSQSVTSDDHPTPKVIPSYRSLFELNIKRVPLTASFLFEKIRDQKQKADSVLSSIPNILRFGTIYPDGTRKPTVFKTENIYQKLKTVFKEKNYSYDEFIIVDQNEIFVDFTNEKSLPRISSEYQIISKTLLVSVILEFESKESEYLVTSKCQISSIITHFLIDHRLTFASSDTFLGFFDELGSYIHEDETIQSVYRSHNNIRIKIIKYEDNTSELSDVVLIFDEGND